MSRPLTHSSQISAKLEEMNTRFEAKTQLILDRLPPPTQELSEEEKATLIKLGLPIPEPRPTEDAILTKFEEMSRHLAHHIVGSNEERRRQHSNIEDRLATINSTITGMSWAMAAMLAIVMLIWISSWQGCDFTPRPSPDPTPIPSPEPGPGPHPNPSPNPTPTPPPIGVIQLDSTEMAIYRFAIENVQGTTDAERRASLNFLLGNISQKAEILRQFPNQRVELLP